MQPQLGIHFGVFLNRICVLSFSKLSIRLTKSSRASSSFSSSEWFFIWNYFSVLALLCSKGAYLINIWKKSFYFRKLPRLPLLFPFGFTAGISPIFLSGASAPLLFLVFLLSIVLGASPSNTLSRYAIGSISLSFLLVPTYHQLWSLYFELTHLFQLFLLFLICYLFFHG